MLRCVIVMFYYVQVFGVGFFGKGEGRVVNKVSLVMSLKSTKSVTSVHFSNDNNFVMYCDADNIYVYNVNVDYKNREDPKLYYKLSVAEVAALITDQQIIDKLKTEGFRTVFPSHTVDDVAVVCGAHIIFLCDVTRTRRVLCIPMAHRGSPVYKLVWNKDWVCWDIFWVLF